MSAIGPIIDNFEDAQKAEAEKNYLRAARYYRLCALFYENGELPIYDSGVEKYGSSALSHYADCKSKLTHEAQLQLDEEEAKYTKGGYFIDNWCDFVDEEFKRIVEEQDTPSPNQVIMHRNMLDVIYSGGKKGGCLPLLLALIILVLLLIF